MSLLRAGGHSRRRLCRLHSQADRGELIGGQGLLREQQAGAFIEIGTARAQDVGRRAEALRHQVADRDVDLALRGVRGVNSATAPASNGWGSVGA